MASSTTCASAVARRPADESNGVVAVETSPGSPERGLSILQRVWTLAFRCVAANAGSQDLAGIKELDSCRSGRAKISQDPLLALCQEDAKAATTLLQVLAVSGGLIAPAVAALCLSALMWLWTPAAKCEKPLRLWLLVHASLQLLQAPVKLSLLAAVDASSGVAEKAAGVMSSWAWRSCRKLTVPSHLWFAMGIVWLAKSFNSETCPLGLLVACACAAAEGTLRILTVYFLVPHLFDLEKIAAADAAATNSGAADK